MSDNIKSSTDKPNYSLKVLIGLLRDLALREHYLDDHFVCSKSDGSRLKDSPNTKCSCGVEAHNKSVEIVMKKLREYLVPDEEDNNEM